MHSNQILFFYTPPVQNLLMAPCCLQNKIQTPWPGVQGPPQSCMCLSTTLPEDFSTQARLEK